MSWRRAYSLVILGNEIHSISPQTTIYDIGDSAHQAEASDHNPNSAGVVCAIDVMAGYGLDLEALANSIRLSSHPDLKYVIYNRRIASRKYGFEWRAYPGSNPHTDHIHVSVGVGSDGKSVPPYDDTNSWNIGLGGTLLCSYGQSGPIVMALQTLLFGLGFDPGPIDGKYGDKTKLALAKCLDDPNEDGSSYGPWQYAAVMIRSVGKGPKGDKGDPGPPGGAAVLAAGTTLVIKEGPVISEGPPPVW